jgi:hypothetical protein
VTKDEIDEFVHECVHELIEINDGLQKHFGIHDYKRYHYDMDQERLVFRHDDGSNPGVVAIMQVVGSTSTKSKTWLWGWANPHVPENATKGTIAVRDFGVKNGISKLIEEKWEATEEDGWEMSAVCNRIMKAKGAYRCPSENGALFLVLTDIRRVQ